MIKIDQHRLHGAVNFFLGHGLDYSTDIAQ